MAEEQVTDTEQTTEEQQPEDPMQVFREQGFDQEHTPDAPPAEPPPAEEPPPDEPALSPNGRWPLGEREAFAGLPREVQQAWLDRDARINQEFQQRHDQTAPVLGFLNQWGQYAQQHYQAPPLQMLEQLARRDFEIRSFQGTPEQKVQKGLEYLDQLGIPWREVLLQQPPVDEDGNPDPTAAAIQQAVAPLQQELAALKNGNQTQQNQAQQAQQQQRAQEWNTLLQRAEAAVEQDGKTPMFPHFHDVQNEMAFLYQAEFQQGHFDLSEQHFIDNYQKAVYMNPQVRDHLLKNGQGQSNGGQPNPATPNGTPPNGQQNSQQKVVTRKTSTSVGGGAATPASTDKDLTPEERTKKWVEENGGLEMKL